MRGLRAKDNANANPLRGNPDMQATGYSARYTRQKQQGDANPAHLPTTAIYRPKPWRHQRYRGAADNSEPINPACVCATYL